MPRSNSAGPKLYQRLGVPQQITISQRFSKYKPVAVCVSSLLNWEIVLWDTSVSSSLDRCERVIRASKRVYTPR